MDSSILCSRASLVFFFSGKVGSFKKNIFKNVVCLLTQLYLVVRSHVHELFVDS